MGRGGERHPLEPVVHELTRYQGDISVELDQIEEEVSQRFERSAVHPWIFEGKHESDLHEQQCVLQREKLDHQKTYLVWHEPD